jgi:hypothetical protein
MYPMLRTSVATPLPLLCTAIGLLLCAGVGARADKTQLVPVGVAKVDITPDQPVRMYGYASRKTESEGIAGRLNAKALALGGEQGNELAVLLTVDCGAVPEDVRDEVYRRVQAKVSLKPERFVLCNSHCHSGPNLKGMKSTTDEERQHLADYGQELTDRLEKVVLNAIALRRPGRLAWTRGTVGFAANRRVLTDGKWTGFGAVPEAPVDHSLPLLRVTDDKDQLIAVVVNYACHCTTLRGDFMQIHGDWAACAQEYIETDHPDAIAMVTIGCGADSDPCPHSTVELCEQHGRQMADEVKRLLKGEFTPIDPTLVARSEPLKVAYQTPPTLEELERRDDRSWALDRLKRQLEQGKKPPASQSLQVATWVFGEDLAMVFLSDEFVVDYALRLKREMDGSRLWINAYTNDVSCYVASERVLREGGYEARNSLSSMISYGDPESVQPSIEDRLIEHVRSLLPASFLAK